MKSYGAVTLVSILLTVSNARGQDIATPRAGQLEELIRHLRCDEAEAMGEEHQQTFYREKNLGECYYHAHQYTKGRFYFDRALSHIPNADDPVGKLQLGYDVEQARKDRADCSANVAIYQLRVRPIGATLKIDGSPLFERVPTTSENERSSDGAPSAPEARIAGIYPQGPGSQVPASEFILEIDPGLHQFSLSWNNGLSVDLDRTVQQPKFVVDATSPPLFVLDANEAATLRVEATQPGALVTIGDTNAGTAPLSFKGAPGEYRIRIFSEGFETYDEPVKLQTGKSTIIHADLAKEPLTKKPAFWATVIAAAAGTIVAGYLIAREVSRPDPVRGPVDGGGLGWALRVE